MNRKKRSSGGKEPPPPRPRWTLRPEGAPPLPPPPHADLPDLEMPSRISMEASLRRFSGVGAGRPRDRREEAQNLYYEAAAVAERGEGREAVRLAQMALKLHPACSDALLLLQDFSSQDVESKINDLRIMVEAAEKDLGPGYIEENRGHFWGLLETRPYIRARTRLAEYLAQAGRREEAAAEYEAILVLNTSDNQGVRDVLVGLYLALGRPEGARSVFERFPDDAGGIRAWGEVLERFLSRDIKGAAVALAKARRENRHAEAYLTGRKKMPRTRQPYYSPGQESEGVLCGDIYRVVCAEHPDLSAWLEATR